MTGTEYQKLAQRTSNTKGWYEKVENGVMGLNGEAGEVIDLIKKARFQGHEFDREHLIEELGDVLWYCAELAQGLGVTLDEVAELNIQKLMKRYPDGFRAERSKHRDIGESKGDS